MALGLVLTPYGRLPNGAFPAAISASYKGAETWAQPFDPQWNERGEAGYYYDTQLGSTPTDFELSRRHDYMPVRSGWTVTKQGYLPGGWLPPDGGYPGQPQALRFQPVPFDRYSLRGLGEVPGPQPQATAEDVLDVMAAHNDRVFALTLVSTTAVAISALIGLFRTLKLIKEGKG